MNEIGALRVWRSACLAQCPLYLVFCPKKFNIWVTGRGVVVYLLYSMNMAAVHLV